MLESFIGLLADNVDATSTITSDTSISTTLPRFEDAPTRNAFEYLQMIYIARNSSYWLTNAKHCQKTRLFCNKVRFGRSRSSRSMILVTVESPYATSYLSPIVTMVLSLMHRFWDTVTYWLIGLPIFATFLIPLSHSAPSLPIFPLEFRAEVNREETRIMWLSCSEDRMILALCLVVLVWY